MSSVVPEGWEMVSLSQLDLDISDGNYSSKYPTSDEFVKVGVPFLRANNIGSIKVNPKNIRFISNKKHTELKKGHLKKSDILISTRGEIGKVCVVQDAFIDANINAQLVRINGGQKLNSFFLFHILRSDSSVKQLADLQTGTALKQLPVGNLLKLTIPFMPYREQKKIASILTSVDEVIENTQKQIDKLQDLKKATMNELLTKGIGHTEFKDSELGRIPKSWEVRAISEVVSIPNGQVDPKLEPYASMPHIGSGNIISWIGQIKGVQTAFEAGQISGKYLFSKNHILYSKVRPNLAKVCMPQFDGICSADVYPLIPKQKVSGKFVFQYLLTEKFTQIATEVSERTGMPKINRQDLNVLKLPMPPFEEQSEIARKIEAIDKATSLKSIKLAQTKSLKKSLMQDLLTGKVRVAVN